MLTISDKLVLLQLLMTIVGAGAVWALKTVLQNHLGPIQKDINLVGQEVQEINGFLKQHHEDKYAHPNLVNHLETKFANKESTEVKLDYFEQHVRDCDCRKR